MSGDPDDLKWLDYDTVLARWQADAARFLAHHPDLTDRQKQSVAELLEGPQDFRAELEALPPGRDIPDSLKSFVQFRPDMKRIIVDGRKHLSAAERDRLLALADSDGDALLEAPNPQTPTSENLTNWELANEYREAIQRVWQRASRLSYAERLKVLLGSDPDLPRVKFGNFSGGLTDEPRDVDFYYRDLLDQYQKQVAEADISYERQHADVLWEEIQELRASLVNPVKSLESQFREDLGSILTLDQRRAGPPPAEWTPLRDRRHAHDHRADHAGRAADHRVPHPAGGRRGRGDDPLLLPGLAAVARRARGPGAGARPDREQET